MCVPTTEHDVVGLQTLFGGLGLQAGQTGGARMSRKGEAMAKGRARSRAMGARIVGREIWVYVLHRIIGKRVKWLDV